MEGKQKNRNTSNRMNIKNVTSRKERVLPSSEYFIKNCFFLLLLLLGYPNKDNAVVFVDSFSSLQISQPQRRLLDFREWTKRDGKSNTMDMDKQPFTIRRHQRFPTTTTTTTTIVVYSSSSSSSSTETENDNEDNVVVTNEDESSIDKMKIKDIQNELKERNVSYTDCFDRESLSKRLLQARKGEVVPQDEKESVVTAAAAAAAVSKENPKQEGATSSTQEKETPSSSTTKTKTTTTTFNREEVQNELSKKTIRELREECGKYHIRWSTFLEKREFIQALLKYKETITSFSLSNAMLPGQVTDLTDDQLLKELSGRNNNDDTTKKSLFLLDIYATWCGPCQMMIPEMNKVAKHYETNYQVRIGKIDSDKYPNISSKFRVGGLPTLLLLETSNNDDKPFKELKRIEGAVMSNNLIQLIEEHL